MLGQRPVLRVDRAADLSCIPDPRPLLVLGNYFMGRMGAAGLGMTWTSLKPLFRDEPINVAGLQLDLFEQSPLLFREVRGKNLGC
jgi:hypothetical protein